MDISLLKRPEKPIELSVHWSECQHSETLRVPEAVSADVFESIQRRGMHLQRGLVEPEKFETELVTVVEELESFAALDDTEATHLSGWAAASPKTNLDDRLGRIAAAYHLWPWYAAEYYGYLSDRAESERLAARDRLCDIQRLLHAHYRWTAVFLQTSFNLWSFEGVERYLRGDLRHTWRHATLTGGDRYPDLCAVDELGAEIVKILMRRPQMREALHQVQYAINNIDEANSSGIDEHAVLSVFDDFHVTHLMVFYQDRPASLDMVELLRLKHADDQAPRVLQRLFPFRNGKNSDRHDHHSEDARGYRKLVQAIHQSHSQPREGKLFVQHSDQIHKLLTKVRDRAGTLFIPEGQATKAFHRNPQHFEASPFFFKPDVLAQLARLDHNSIEDYEAQIHMPDAPQFWWEHVPDRAAYLRKLFPGPEGRADDAPVYGNSHASAFADHLAQTDRRISGTWGAVQQRLDGIAADYRDADEEDVVHLCDLLLREHDRGQARTTFYFSIGTPTFVTRLEEAPMRVGDAGFEGPDAASRPVAVKRTRMSHFVTGSFLGLERPGIPFEPYRFERMADHLRELVFALTHFASLWRDAEQRRDDKIRHRNYHNNVKDVLHLLSGTASDGGRNYFRNSPHEGQPGLLFFSVHGGVSDHEPESDRPSRQQLRNVFDPGHGPQPPSSFRDGECDKTWKSMFILAHSCGTVEQYLAKREELIANLNHHSLGEWSESYSTVNCSRCLMDVIVRLLPGSSLVEQNAPRYRVKYNNKEIGFHVGIDRLMLPTRPGVRFLLAMCDWIFRIDMSSGGKGFIHVDRVDIQSGQVTLKYNTPCEGLGQHIFRTWRRPRMDLDAHGDDHVTTSLCRLLHAFPYIPYNESIPDIWIKILTDKIHALPLWPIIAKDSLTLRWPVREGKASGRIQ